MYFARSSNKRNAIFHLPCVKAVSLEAALLELRKSWGIRILSNGIPVPLGSICYKWQERSPRAVGANPEKSEDGEVYYLPNHTFVFPMPSCAPIGSFFPLVNLPEVPEHDRAWLESALLHDAPFHCEIAMYFAEPIS